MTNLAALQMDNAIELDSDVLPSGYDRVDTTGVYDFIVQFAYLVTSKSGAMSLKVHFQTPKGGNFTTQFWMTSGAAKGGNNYYIDKKTGAKSYLPGFVNANNLGLLTVGKGIGELETEEKTVKLYDYEQKKEVPTNVNMFTDLLNQPVKAAVVKQAEDKNAANEAGDYVPTGDFRVTYDVSKIFRDSDSKTVAEIKAEEDATFIERWATQYPPETIVDRTKNKAYTALLKTGVDPFNTTQATAGGNPSVAKPGADPVKSLFL